ncbi:methyltransferase domain-containing protein [Kribbella sp. NBC_00382]|uniref:class I SAM-dependent methyltransferase n=1 Tax=Kribbella sp. NBC_00382 TaxID=2975967 RepID=UPI002E1AFE90
MTAEAQVGVEVHYTERCDEEVRLRGTWRGRFELARMQHLLMQYLPEAPAEVADIGGGPGVHACWLKERGYEVELLDPVERHIEQATAAGINAVLGDARRLPWENEHFDAALLAGPIYHLTEASDRRLALREAIRVVRPGGFIAVVAINRAANLIGSTIANTLLTRQQVVTDILDTGFSPDNERMAETVYHTTTQLRTELVNAGLASVTIHGLTGPGGWLTVAIDRYFGEIELPDLLQQPPPMDTALECSRLADRHPELTPASSLLFAVGQRV